jgi:hypothetical protein
MKLTIGPYSITIRKIPKTKQVGIDISGTHVIYKVLGEELTLMAGSVPEDLRPQLERIIKTHFRTKV